MENTENAQQVDNLISINPEIRDYLLEISKWGKFLAIVGYIGMGLLLLIGLGIMIGGSVISSISEVDFPLGILGFLYVLLAALYFLPVNYLYKFSYQIKQGFGSDNQQSVTAGFANLKSLFKFMGIFTIVILSIYALILVVAVPIAIFMG
ncbi:MAG: hypothetical protein IPN67_19095 [Bacteroidales bacterium]|nr:hypothetical protein [Bacteroidales bacterium]